jgi:hypothetical protein
MAKVRRTAAAKGNVKKVQQPPKAVAKRARAVAQPKGRSRAKPGATGEGEFFHIEVRPRSRFRTFRTQDVGEPGGIERVAGKRESGTWATQKWLISKKHAHLDRGHLVPDTADARHVLEELGSAPVHVVGDRFKAKPRRNVPEREKPTPAQKRARASNIKKAQAARRKR